MNLFLAPHNDDESLFGAYTLMREKCLVLLVTDSYIQENRGDNITAGQRREETRQAIKILNCPLVFGSLRDDALTEESVADLLKNFWYFDKVYAPAVYGNGNPQHDLIGKVALGIFQDKVVPYATYTKDNLWMNGKTEIIPTIEEIELKNKALDCYHSQLGLPSTRPHFNAVRGRSEWYA